MKRFLFVFLAVAMITAAVFAVTANAASENCPYCGRAPEEWQEVYKTGQSVADGHYYLGADGLVLGSNTIASGKKTCLDLRGYKVTANKNIIVNGNMHVWNGEIVTRGVDGVDGGAFSVNASGELYLNKVALTWDTKNGRKVNNGGYISCNGFVEMKDTTLTDGVAQNVGGNLYVGYAGQLVMDGGSITGGKAKYGDCTYIRGPVTLKGNASIDVFRCVPYSGYTPQEDMLTLDSSFKGSVVLENYKNIAAGANVGNVAADADLSGVRLQGGEFDVKYENGQLIAYVPKQAAVMKDNALIQEYDSVQDAVDKAEEGQYVCLQRSATEKLTVSHDVLLDLNGYDLEEVEVTGGQLLVKDSQTDDYAVSDGVYGKIKAYSGDVKGQILREEERYLAYEEENGGLSFHKLYVDITEVNLRPSVAGLYYTSLFKGDQIIKQQVDTFGVELAVNKKNLQDDVLATGCYTSINQAQFSDDAVATSTVLTNVMRADASVITNRRNAATAIYCRPYIRFIDGTMLWGKQEGDKISLKWTMEYVSKNMNLSQLEAAQKNGLLSLCNRFHDIIANYWDTEALMDFCDQEETETLRILTIGNSHGNDSNWQLQNVFAHQNPDQKVTVGILYYSGCSVSQHVNFAKKDLAEYQYYKNENGTWVGDDTPKDTMRQALEDEQWDIVILQETNVHTGLEATFQNNDNINFLVNYVKQYTRVEPQIGWNMVWANPVIDAYLDADTRMTHSMENGQSLDGWINSYEKNFGTNQQYMFACMLENVQKYILTNENLNKDYIMPSGTAVQYANNTLGLTDTDLYRDYTHLSEMSRLMVAYLWYAKLTGDTFDSIEDIKVNEIPRHLRHSRFASEGGLKITDEMKEVILDSINYALENPFEMPEIPPQTGPDADGTINLLLIGNSFCTYFPDELKAMADAAGKTLRVCNVYYSGCTLEQHYGFLKNGEEVYEFRVNGQLQAEKVSLWYCLEQGNWDYISFQEGSSTVRGATVDVAKEYKENVKYFAYLHDAVAERFPSAQLVFHQTWAYQVGTTSTDFTTADVAAQSAHHQRIVAYTKLFMDRYPDVDLVNTGDAWALIREGGYDQLCARLGKKVGNAAADTGDNYHDGDIGGGQYLNACVWYEYLFGLDVRENTFVPTYDRPGTTGVGTLETDGSGNYNLRINRKNLQDAAHAVSSRWVSPSNDDEFNVFFVSNSTCYYFTDELYGMLEAAGYENVTLALVYYSGCSIQQHHSWMQSGTANYQFRVLDKDGLHVYEGYSLEQALGTKVWDVISFDNNAGSFSSGDIATSLANAEPYFGELLEQIKKWQPNARYFWHEVWANEIGYSLAFNMETIEQRTAVWNAKRGVAKHMENTYGVEVVPTGDAWEPVRDLPLFTTPVAGTGVEKFTLCSRTTAYDTFKDDFSHDGDIGGGQYLNACVWFEKLTGKSCVGNNFRPKYTLKGIDCSLTEEKISVLQNAAHNAVENWDHPSNDDELNILFIGDSASYYWTDELYGMLTSAGYKNVRVCNAYYSTELKNIWTYLQNDTAKFTLFTVDENGRHGQENVTLKYAIDAQKWDCISFHQGKSAMSMADKAVALAKTEPYITNLLAYAQNAHPRASYYWDENWVPEIGYSNSTYTMSSQEQQAQMLATLQYVAREVSKKHGLTVIPNGNAWTPVRDLPLFTTPVAGTGVEKFTLCSRITDAGTFKDDLGHDGDIGGGQYLNACVVFEVLTGTSCLPNTYRPAYTLKGIDCSLTQEKIDLLKNAAHEAVTNWN